MKKSFFKPVKTATILLSSAVLLFACNKVYEPIAGPTPPVVDAANTLTKKLTADTTYSILLAGLARTGLNTVLDEPNANFTVFAPNNNSFRAAGLPLAVVNALPLAQLTAVLQHHVIPNERIAAANIPTTFPNVQKGTALNIATNNLVTGLSSTAIPIKMTIYPSRRATGAWANNIPVVEPDVITASNGVVHRVATIIAPPSQTLVQALQADTDFTYLLAAVARADSGIAPTSTSSLQFALSLPFASLTVFAPTNTAFRNLLVPAIAQALISQGVDPVVALAQATFLASTPAVFSTPALYPVLTPTFVRGILVHHVLGQRAFAPNFPATAANFPTLLNTVIANHPGLSINAAFTGPFATGLSVKGIGNLTAATAAPTTTGAVDRQAVNGVFYKIDQVLLPQ
jgi:uncharacterized surface protein with fasciclin (FAS1) repeats